jgi:hypothetical protein
MNRLPLMAGVLGAGLLIGVLSPAVADASSTTFAGNAGARTASASRQAPESDGQRKIDAAHERHESEGAISPRHVRESTAGESFVATRRAINSSRLGGQSANQPDGEEREAITINRAVSPGPPPTRDGGVPNPSSLSAATLASMFRDSGVRGGT